MDLEAILLEGVNLGWWRGNWLGFLVDLEVLWMILLSYLFEGFFVANWAFRN